MVSATEHFGKRLRKDRGWSQPERQRILDAVDSLLRDA